MSTLVYEDLSTTCTATDALMAWLDANERDQEAARTYGDRFNTDEHVDRIVKVGEIIKDFFSKHPNYYTKRANRGRPFETVKLADCGRMLSRCKPQEKNEKLYKPLLDLGNVDVKTKNGHLLVRVYA